MADTPTTSVPQLDHMTLGRVMFGVGPGLLTSDALMLGIDLMTPVAEQPRRSTSSSDCSVASGLQNRPTGTPSTTRTPTCAHLRCLIQKCRS